MTTQQKATVTQWINTTQPSVRTIRGSLRAARNKPCPCGSGIKYKKCDHPLR